METRKLGSSGLSLSLVGLGTNNFGGRIDLEASRKVMHAALDAGVTHFDTADIYGNSGGSETVIGKVLGARRDEVVLATKFGKPMSDAHSDHRGSRAYIRSAVEASLRRLQTDRIDLLFMHEPDPSTSIAETLGVLDELVKAGKVRHVAASNFSAAEIDEAVAAAKKLGVEGFIGAQDEYSLTFRDHETTLFPALTKTGSASARISRWAAARSPGSTARARRIPRGRATRMRPAASSRRIWIRSRRSKRSPRSAAARFWNWP